MEGDDQKGASQDFQLETVGEDFKFELCSGDIRVRSLKPGKRIKRRVPAETALVFSTGHGDQGVWGAKSYKFLYMLIML